MAEGATTLAFEIGLAMRDVRLYWRADRALLSPDEKQKLAEAILDGLKRSRTLTVLRGPPPCTAGERESTCGDLRHA